MPTNKPLIRLAFQFWVLWILVSGFNFFILMSLICEPIWGELAAHQIGMPTRIVYINIIAYFLLWHFGGIKPKTYFMLGFYG
jgi:hypothetical protein